MQTAIKKGLEDYFGKGKRAPVPLTKENPISAVVQRCTERCDLQQDMADNGGGSARTNPDGLGVSNSNERSTPNTTKGNTSRRGASNEEGQNKKARSNEEDSGVRRQGECTSTTVLKGDGRPGRLCCGLRIYERVVEKEEPEGKGSQEKGS